MYQVIIEQVSSKGSKLAYAHQSLRSDCAYAHQRLRSMSVLWVSNGPLFL